MSLNKLNFTKDWTKPEDFPTIETSEAQVRLDMQQLHDETKEFINSLVSVLDGLGVETTVQLPISAGMKYIRLNSDKCLEVSSDGKTWQATKYKHNHSDESINPSSIELSPNTSSGHGGYIDFHFKGSTEDYTSRIIENNGAVLLNDNKILTSANVIALYNVTLTFSNGVATYSHSAIKSSSVCFVQWRAGAVSTLTDSVLSTTNGNGSITIIAKSGKTGDVPVNILILNL